MERPEFKGKEIKGDIRGEGSPKPALDGDLVIMVDKNSEGILFSPNMRVYCKDTDGNLQQVGMIQQMNLTADMNDPEVHVKAKLVREMPEMSEQMKLALKRNQDRLETSGVNLDLCTCECRGGQLGIDPNCPVHCPKTS